LTAGSCSKKKKTNLGIHHGHLSKEHFIFYFWSSKVTFKSIYDVQIGSHVLILRNFTHQKNFRLKHLKYSLLCWLSYANFSPLNEFFILFTLTLLLCFTQFIFVNIIFPHFATHIYNMEWKKKRGRGMEKKTNVFVYDILIINLMCSNLLRSFNPVCVPSELNMW
jgi:hypothetical protein